MWHLAYLVERRKVIKICWNQQKLMTLSNVTPKFPNLTLNIDLDPLNRKIHTQNHFHSISRLKIHRNAKNYNDKLINVCFIRIHAQHTAAHLHYRQFLKNAAYFSLTPNFFLMSGIYRRRLDRVTS